MADIDNILSNIDLEEQKIETEEKDWYCVEVMSQDTKEKIRDLEGQKIMLEDRLEHLGYSGNLVKMHEIEEEIFEIDDTILKLTA